MNDESRVLYISAAVNFVVGIVIGIILFYGQLKSAGNEISPIYEYDKNVSFADFFRLLWINILWMLSVFFARCILPVGVFHPIVTIRGLISSFSFLYIFSAFGIREASTSVIPQCFSALPLIYFFSVKTVTKYRYNVQNGFEPCSLKRYEIAEVFMWSVLSAATEVLFFRFFGNILF